MIGCEAHSDLGMRSGRTGVMVSEPSSLKLRVEGREFNTIKLVYTINSWLRILLPSSFFRCHDSFPTRIDKNFTSTLANVIICFANLTR